MSFRVGIDLVPYSRAQQLISDRNGLLARHLSPAEIDASTMAAGLDVAGVAGRLAAKEAYFKLLRIPGKPLPWLAIEVLASAGGWPLLTRGYIPPTGASVRDVDISISHDGGYAVAVAIGAVTERSEDPERPENPEKHEYPEGNQQ